MEARLLEGRSVDVGAVKSALSRIGGAIDDAGLAYAAVEGASSPAAEVAALAGYLAGLERLLGAVADLAKVDHPDARRYAPANLALFGIALAEAADRVDPLSCIAGEDAALSLSRRIATLADGVRRIEALLLFPVMPAAGNC